jgi:hypothetical protein
MTITIVGGGNPSGPTFPVQRSVRLRSSASAFFNRTPASATNRKTWTWSAWIKRGDLANVQTFFAARPAVGGNPYTILYFSGSTLIAISDNGLSLTANNLLRDPSSWYHIVLNIDTTQATSSNRAALYINGILVSYSSAAYPAQNADLAINSTTNHYIGVNPSIGQYFDGYLTEINFIDGQALTPTSFGAYNSFGVWSPAKYTGTYGTNGFYLNFQDNSAATATTIGKDSSGNGNNWTPNNISVTAGVTYDSMLDVPTLTSNTNANFATLNPLNSYLGNTGLINGNLTYGGASLSGYNTSPSTISVSSGKWYWEITIVTLGGAGTLVGISADTRNWVNTLSYVGATSDSYGYYFSGTKYNNATAAAYGAAYTNGDVIGVALDLSAGTLTFYKNNVSQGVAYSSLTGSFVAGVSVYPTSGVGNLAANFGQRPFTYTPPSGFVALNTYNLPATTIPNGATQFAATTYTGNGSSQTVVNTVNGTSMQPDFLWIKGRSGATDHQLLDTVRGANGVLVSNSTAAETVYGAGQVVFNSNGFIVGGLGTMNTNAATYVGWQWKANGTPAVTNTNGTIPSTISANPTAGFSIVTYTGTGANATVGHGLGIAPKMVIVKQRTALPSAQNWIVGHTSMGWGSWMWLDLTNGQQTNIVVWNNTAPTSSVFSVGTGNGVNVSTGTYVAYCFSEIAGYSKFGSYTGNGSVDGPFVYLGFRPRFILRKRTDTTSDWLVQDSSRPGYNATTTYTSVLYADTSGAETIYNEVDILSNGFKIRASDAFGNASGGTYIYAAFAENPFNYSLAR